MKRLIYCILIPGSIATLQAQDIRKAEYFFDADPGFGQGVPLSSLPAQEAVSSYSLSTENLSEGFHTVSIRIQNENGVWSMLSMRSFYVTSPAIEEGYLSAEYFFDENDPGLGQATPIRISKTAGQEEIMLNIPTTSLSAGPHSLFVRIRDQSGRWGFSERTDFAVDLVTGTTIATDKENKVLYPNPVQNRMYSTLKGPYVITDMAGKVINRNISEGFIDLQHLTSGVYHILFEGSEAIRFIKQ